MLYIGDLLAVGRVAGFGVPFRGVLGALGEVQVPSPAHPYRVDVRRSVFYVLLLDRASFEALIGDPFTVGWAGPTRVPLPGRGRPAEDAPDDTDRKPTPPELSLGFYGPPYRGPPFGLAVVLRGPRVEGVEPF